MEKAVLSLGFARGSLRLRLVQTCKFHTSLIKVKKYRLLDHGYQKTFLGQLRKEGTSAKDAKVEGIPYNKLSIGVPKETWREERR